MKKDEQHYVDNSFRGFFKRWPRFYYVVMVVFGPALFLGKSPKKFLKEFPREGKTVNLGSGPRVLAPDIINIDITPFDNVSIVADITNLPIQDNSIARIVCDNVLEHVQRAEKAVSEIHRVLERGGVAYISTPFLYPFHSSPDDFYRWTTTGLRTLLEDFEIVELDVRSGIFSTLTVYLCYAFATIFSFGIQKIYWPLVHVFMVLFFPLKFLDLISNLFTQSRDTAAVYYCIVRKR
jgi:SAM-dependent methyltransferase